MFELLLNLLIKLNIYTLSQEYSHWIQIWTKQEGDDAIVKIRLSQMETFKTIHHSIFLCVQHGRRTVIHTYNE